MRPINSVSRIVASFIGIGLIIGSCLGQAPNTPRTSDVLRFDAKWWQQADSDEQQGFIYGYMDCRQPPKSSNASTVEYQNAVSAMMESQKTSDPNAVTKAIEHAWMSLKSRDIQGGENYGGPHGFLDGEWWGGFEGRPWPPNLADADRGYLEGYLECSSAPVTAQAVSRYQAVLNRHYASGRYEHDKIADVLKRLLKSHVSSCK